MSEPIKHVVMFSAGAGSFEAAWRVVQAHGRRSVTLLFTDTLCEDHDAYRFLIEGAALLLGYAGRGEVSGLAALGANTPPAWERDARKAHLIALRADVVRLMPELVWVQEGRDIWDVFADERFLGNSRVGVCTRTLKQETADRWCNAHCDPAATVRYVGIDWTEIERYEGDGGKRKGIKRVLAEQGWRCDAPLCEKPWMTKTDALDHMRALGIKPPRLYELGFAHNNCGGGCVKAGIGHFAHLYRALPDVFAHWEREETKLRDMLGENVSILADRRGDGKKKPLPLATLRARIEAGQQIDMYEIGGCGCFIDTEDAA